MDLSEDFSGIVKTRARGSLVLMVGQVVQTVITALMIILVARLIGADENGRVAVVMIPVNLALLLQNLGVTTALTLYSARFRHEDRFADLKLLVRTGLAFSTVVALVCSAALFLFAGPISAIWLQRPELESLVRLASFTVMGQALISTVQSIFVGFELMSLYAALPIGLAILRGALVFPLVLTGSGAFGPVVSFSVASLVVGIIGIVLYFYFVREKVGISSLSVFGALKMILKYGLPLYMGTLLGGCLSLVQNTLMATYASTELIGNYSAAMNFGVLISFFTLPISLTLFPMFSKMSRKDPMLGSFFQNALKYTNLIVTPMAACLIVVSSPLTNVLYGSGYPFAALFLSFYFITYLFEGLGGTSLSYLLFGLGESRVIFYSNVIQLLIGVSLSLILVPRFQIMGLIAAMIITPRISFLYLLVWLKKNTGLTINWGASARVFLSTFAASFVSFLELTFLHMNGWIALLICSISFFVVYLVTLPISGVLDLNDIRQLNEIAGVAGPLSPILRKILSLMSHLINLMAF